MRRYCAHTNRHGGPCQARPLTGTDACTAHSSPEVREEIGFIPANGRAGRKPKPSAQEFLGAWFAEHEPVLLEVLTSALAAVRGGDPDHDVRLRALWGVLDRFYGRPRQTTELTGPKGGPVQVTDPDQDLSLLNVEELEVWRELVVKATPGVYAGGDGGGA